jgi:hypothetical protein
MASAQSVTFAGSQAVNFGSVNVCPLGQTTPAPCNKKVTLSYKVTASGKLGAPLVLTGATPDEDFALASGSTCTGAVTEGSTCTVNVTFAPRAPGARNGGVEIVDGSGNVLASTYLYGTGMGPAIAFDTGTSNAVAGYSYVDIGPSLAMTVDASGNVFFLLYPNNTLNEVKAVNGSIPPNPTVTVLASDLPPTVAGGSGLAVDGSGNLFVANDNGSRTDSNPASNPVTEIVAAGGYTTLKSIGIPGTFGVCVVDGSGNVFIADSRGAIQEILAVNGVIPVNPTINTVVSGVDFAGGLAVDGSGNLFFGDDNRNDNEVEEILAVNGSIPTNPTVTTLGSGFSSLGVFVADGSGNLFFVDDNEVREMLAVNGSIPTNPTINTLGSGFTSPSSLVLEASGNVIVADTSGIHEILAEGGYTKVITLFDAFAPSDIAVDGGGNIFYPFFYSNPDGPPGEPATDEDYSIGISELQRSHPPLLGFSDTQIGSASSPNSVQIQNIGNQPLTGSGTLSDTVDFAQVFDTSSVQDCSYGLSLAPGAGCNLSFSFTPQSPGPLAGILSLSDNGLNGNPATQKISLSGTGIAPQPHITGLSANYGAPYANITLTGTNFGASPGAVDFGNLQASVLSWSGTRITVTVPNGAPSGNIYVYAQYSSPQASNGVPFTIEPRPSVTGISPTSGPAGTVVTISGENLLDAQGHGQVWLNTQSLPIVSQSNTSLQVTIPSGAVTGVFDVHVNGVGRSTPVFTVPGAPANPHLTSLSANYGALYAIISLNGTGFGAVQGSSDVTFNGVPATAYVWTNTGITVTVPYRATTGNVVVTVAGQASNGLSFTVELTPSVTGISPSTGPPGTIVTISGQNLRDAEGHGTVYFSGISLPILNSSATSIQVEIPPGASSDVFDVHINGVGVYTPTFTVTN